MGDLVPRNVLVKQGMKGVGGIVGGGALLLLSSLGGVVGWIIGGVLTAVGLGISTSRDDRVAGLITAGAGVLTLVSQLPVPLLGGIAGWLMGVGGVGLIVAGGYSLIKFFVNLSKRR